MQGNVLVRTTGNKALKITGYKQLGSKTTTAKLFVLIATTNVFRFFQLFITLSHFSYHNYQKLSFTAASLNNVRFIKAARSTSGTR